MYLDKDKLGMAGAQTETVKTRQKQKTGLELD